MVQRLSLRGAVRDTPDQRLALSRQLAAASWDPAGMPPRAILLLRRIEACIASRPAGRRAEAGEVMPGALENAIGAATAAAYARAHRPSRGRLPTDADAVLFADEAELLACLALDMRRGLHQGRWWWRTVLGRLSPGARSRPFALLLESAPWLPEMIGHLDHWGVTAEVLGGLEADAAAALSAALGRVRGRVSVRSSRNRPGSDSAAPASVPQDHAGALPLGSVRAADPAGGQVAPGSRNSAALQRLLDQCRALSAHLPARRAAAPPMPDNPADRRMPTAGVPAAAPRAAEAVAHPDPARHPPLPGDPGAREQGDAPAGPRRDTAGEPARGGHETTSGRRQAARASAPADGGSPPTARETVPRHSAAGPHGQTEANRAAPASTGTRPVESVVRVQDDRNVAAAATATPLDDHEGLRRARPEPEVPDSLCAWAEGVTTDLGGALYLINLLTALDLPEGWPARPDRPVGLTFWGLLELVARHLLSDPGMDQDPLWALLAVLDHRAPGVLPAGRVGADACIRLPPDWLDGAGASIRCRVDGGRLRCWIDDLPVLDGPDPGSDGARRALLAGLGRPIEPDAIGTPADGEDPGVFRCPHPDPGLRRWLGLLLPCLRWRLAGALRLPTDDPAALAPALLRCRARLYLSGPHLDMVAPLHAISLPVRRAGLDRDPGWLPALGRVVSFHFRETAP